MRKGTGLIEWVKRETDKGGPGNRWRREAAQDCNKVDLRACRARAAATMTNWPTARQPRTTGASDTKPHRR